MSDKRFQKGLNLSCFDTETRKSYWYACNLCGLLNKQQSKINELSEENEQLRHEIEIEKKWQLEKDRYYVDLHKKYDKLEKENEQLKKQVKELKIENEALQDSNDALAEDMFHRLEEVI